MGNSPVSEHWLRSSVSSAVIPSAANHAAGRDEAANFGFRGASRIFKFLRIDQSSGRGPLSWLSARWISSRATNPPRSNAVRPLSSRNSDLICTAAAVDL